MNRWPKPFSARMVAMLFGLSVFSYLPLLQLGKVRDIHIDLSLLYAALLITAGSLVPILWRSLPLLWSYIAWRWLITFQLYASISIFWTTNPIRGAITTVFGWLLVFVVSGIIIYYKDLYRLRQLITRYVQYAFVASIVFATWQLIGDAFHAPSWLTFLPIDYTSSVFGVARPTGFALEPQFFGSLLLIPFGVLLYRKFTGHGSKQSCIAFFIVSAFILLTLSRGALIAVGVLFTLISLFYWPGIRMWSRQGLLLLGAGAVAFLGMGVLSSVRNGSIESGYATIRGTIRHLSLGTISLDRASTPQNSTETIAPTSQPTDPAYVSSSTKSRLTMSQVALELWSSAPLTGVGLGGFGLAAHKISDEYQTGAVTNNYYLELLAELGVIGSLLFAGFLVTLFQPLVRKSQWLLACLASALLVQWAFFSGNANVVHIWLIFGILLAVSQQKVVKNR